MLVYGWTIMGRKRSSYDYTMGFGVSARVAQKSTRLSVTPPQYLSNKINQLLREINIFSYFCTHKSSAKSVGLFSQAVFVFLCSLRRTHGRLNAPTQTCGEICSMRLAQNTKTYRLSSQSPNPNTEDISCAERRGLWLLT